MTGASASTTTTSTTTTSTSTTATATNDDVDNDDDGRPLPTHLIIESCMFFYSGRPWLLADAAARQRPRSVVAAATCDRPQPPASARSRPSRFADVRVRGRRSRPQAPVASRGLPWPPLAARGRLRLARGQVRPPLGRQWPSATAVGGCPWPLAADVATQVAKMCRRGPAQAGAAPRRPR